MRNLLLALTLALAPCAAFSQTTSASLPPICFTMPQAKKLRDSLELLPKVRAEARYLRMSAASYRRGYDSLRTCDALHQSEALRLKDALVNERLLTAGQRAKVNKYRTRAHRKGWWNLALSAVASGALYLVITK